MSSEESAGQPTELTVPITATVPQGLAERLRHLREDNRGQELWDAIGQGLLYPMRESSHIQHLVGAAAHAVRNLATASATSRNWETYEEAEPPVELWRTREMVQHQIGIRQHINPMLTAVHVGHDYDAEDQTVECQGCAQPGWYTSHEFGESLPAFGRCTRAPRTHGWVQSQYGDTTFHPDGLPVWLCPECATRAGYIQDSDSSDAPDFQPIQVGTAIEMEPQWEIGDTSGTDGSANLIWDGSGLILRVGEGPYVPIVDDEDAEDDYAEKEAPPRRARMIEL